LASFETDYIKSTLISFVALGLRSEENAPKNGDPAVGFFFMTMFQHTGQFRIRISSKNNVTTLEHPTYSSDLSPFDFYMFARLVSAMKGERFCDATDIIKNATAELKMIPQNGFQECFQHLCSRWKKCIVSQEEYF